MWGSLSQYFSWESKPLRQPWQSLALAIVGTALLAAAAKTYVGTSAFLDTAIRVPGSVVDSVHHGKYSYPVIAYLDRAGDRHTFESPFGSNPSTHEINESVVVVYAPGAPSRALIYGFWTLWFVPLLMLVLGLAAYVAAVLLWIAMRVRGGAAGSRD
jgi:hypothetical protein